MATTWSGYVNRLRAGIDFTHDRAPTNANPNVVATMRGYGQTNYSTYNFDLSMSYSGGQGSGSGSARATNSNAVLIVSRATTFTASYDGPITYTVNVTCSGNGAGPVSYSRSNTIPRRPTANPSAPTNPRMTVSADRQVRVVWTNATTWPGPAGNRHYRGQLSTNASFTNLVSNTFWTNGGVISGLTRGQTYYMRVRSEANWWDATRTSGWSATVSVTVPNVPTLASTPNATNISRSSWVVPVAQIANNGGQAPTNYRVMVNTTPVDTTNMKEAGSWASVSPSGAAPDTLYYYKVSAYNMAGWGPWTEWKSVRTLDDAPDNPDAPEIDDITETSCTVTWTAPAPNGATITGYDLVISDTNNPSAPVKSYLGLPSSQLSQAVTGLVKAKDYQAFVRAKGTPASSGYSEPGAFRTAGTNATLFPLAHDGEDWKPFELWVNVADEWKRLQLNLNVDGTWKWSE